MISFKQRFANLTHIIKPLNETGAIFCALIIIFNTLIYFLFSLRLLNIIIAFILSIISLIILKRSFLFKEQKDQKCQILPLKNKQKLEKRSIIILVIYASFLLAALLELISAKTIKSIISPWEVISTRFFLFYAINSALLIYILINNYCSRGIKIFLISSQYLLSLIVTAIVYKLGYGFDPFIHQAALEIIAQQGEILPKNPYYIGYYGLIVTIHKFSGIFLNNLNKFITPLFAALFIPSYLYNLNKNLPFNFNNSDNKNKSIWLSALFLLSFSLPLFISSTPQNFSYIFLILAIVSGLNKDKIIQTIIFSLATLAVHPLAGIPAIIWSIWLLVNQGFTDKNKKIKTILKLITIIGGIITLPIALLLISGTKLINLKLNFASLINIFQFTEQMSSAGRENWLMNSLYFLYFNQGLIIIFLVLLGMLIFYKNKLANTAKNMTLQNIESWHSLIIMMISLFIALIISSQVSFQQLISYEQADYAKRILIIITIFSAPLIFLALLKIINKITNTQTKTTKYIWVLIALLLNVSLLYLAYPRFDKYFNSRGYSTGQLDIEAVQLIDKISTENYIVLANQQVSAAALKVFGFNNYYTSHNGPIYFYPIPTGGPLYQYYLDMVYKNPSKDTILKAMDLTGTNEAFFVINKYWNESGKIIKSAKITANDWVELGNKDIFIFRYKK